MDTPSSLSPLTSGVYRGRYSPALGVLNRVSPFLAQAAQTLIPGRNNPDESERLLGNVNSLPERKVDDSYAYEFLKSKASVVVSYSVHYIGNTSIVKALKDESGLFFIHYSIQPHNLSLEGYKDKYYSNIQISGRVSDLEGKTVFQYNREYPIEFNKEQIKQVKMIPMAIQDSFPLVQGNYSFSILLQNTASKEFTSFDTDIIIPEIIDIPQMGDLVLAFKEEENRKPLKRPFKVGEMSLYPCVTREFEPKDTLHLFFQLYGLTEELKEEGWIRYIFFREEKRQDERKKKISEYADKMNFLEKFSLNDFPPSSYNIKVSILDGNEREILFGQENFTIKSKIHTRYWIKSKKYPASDDPIYFFIQGAQFLNKGEEERAIEMLNKAHEMNPEREDFAVVYTRVLLRRGAYKEAKRLLSPFMEKMISDYNFYELLGEAYQGLGEFEEAISSYKNYISHEGVSFQVLNSIGECYFQIGNLKEAQRAWEKSLEIKPDQPEIKKRLKEIKALRMNNSCKENYSKHV